MTDREYERGCTTSNVDESSPNINIIDCCNKLNVYDWLKDINDPLTQDRYVEVRFKNTRKGIFENTSNLVLQTGDIVAVESSPGHDIGIISATGHIAMLQMKKQKPSKDDIPKKVYRKAKASDIQKWREAISLEMPTMIRTREIADNLKLSMKIGDVEFQGDKTKAIFYYIAEERVDFRELIKKMAEEFRIRIEMKQIGARQEASRIGGIGPCGRELCCTTWLYDFNSVSTNSARLQELSLNPQKLAGQCSKLKCCLNYELPIYLNERKLFPEKILSLKTKQGEAFHIKNDIFKQLMYYEVRINEIPVIRALHVNKVKEIMELNKKGIIPDEIFELEKPGGRNAIYKDELNSESLTRFDAPDKKNKNVKKKKKRNFKPIRNDKKD
ncbi:MAG: regulatory iron-sulfur-containing complex subunit RicT [Bacteroidales bacterium]|nr:regulatory iron-sulfur-containing complex subunit RicT [Bacteroidales bacterium]MDD4215721.1 regulatory iron-sulfur-containing complex subunit RicT [Bacteroidales bacterium]MDY0140328.1 regulatory iron-sulfur-containing complex subunit RicT [Bacteroidales bacterium]